MPPYPSPKVVESNACPCCGAPVEPTTVLVDLNSNTIAIGGFQYRVTARCAEMVAALLKAYPRMLSDAELSLEVWGPVDDPSSWKNMAVYASHANRVLKPHGWAIKRANHRGFSLAKAN